MPPSAGISRPQQDTPIGPSSPTSMFGNPATFTAAANTQADDYDKIMQNYQNIISSINSGGSPGSVSPSNVQSPNRISSSSVQSPGDAKFSPTSYDAIAPQTSQYKESGDVTSSLSKLSDLATSGGYDAGGIADLRARGIAPTRSIYANAQQNVERQRALSGGYSPNFNATQAQLARDESNQISDINTNVNAGIAQNVASNRIAAAPAYASAAASENAARTAANQRNADIINQINELNTRNKMATDQFNTLGQERTSEFNIAGRQRANEINSASENRVNEFNASAIAAANEANANRSLESQKFNVDAGLRARQANSGTALAATEGMRNLYGTTPALTNMFGNQVVQAGQLGQGQQQINDQRQRGLYDFATRLG